jgi:MFS family permease
MSSDVTGERAAPSIETSRTIVSLGVSNIALYVVYMGVLQLLLPHQLGLIDPVNKVSLFGAITGVAALAATVANPVAGALSDRTHSPWGRRTPWIVAIAFIAPAALVLLGAMNTIAGVIVGWCLVQMVMNCFQAPFAAILPERVPERSRGVASAALGVGVPLGIIIGTLIGKRYLDTLPVAYGALGLVFALTALAFVALNPEPRGRPVEKAPKPRGRLGDFFSALADADFLWAFVSRFLIQLNY